MGWLLRAGQHVAGPAAASALGTGVTARCEEAKKKAPGGGWSAIFLHDREGYLAGKDLQAKSKERSCPMALEYLRISFLPMAAWMALGT